MMINDLLTKFRGWLSSKTVSYYAPYWEAKKLHEGSPHGLFTRSYYHALSAKEIQEAERCPRLARAITLYQECIEREKSAGRFFNEGIALSQLGLVFHRQGRLAEARQAYQQAAELLADLPDAAALPALSTCHFRLAEIDLVNSNKISAIKHLEKSRSIDESLNDRGGLAMNTELRHYLDSIHLHNHF